MHFKCINNSEREDILTLNKIYLGYFDDQNIDSIYIDECDNGIRGYFSLNRFEVIDEE